MTEENKKDVLNDNNNLKVELSEHEMDEISGGFGVNPIFLIDVEGRGRRRRRGSASGKTNVGKCMFCSGTKIKTQSSKDPITGQWGNPREVRCDPCNIIR